MSSVSSERQTRSPSPTKSRSSRSIFDFSSYNFEDPIQSDLKIIHHKEKEVMAINDEVISLTIAISRLKDKNTSSVETNRKRKLQLIDYQEQLSNRSNVISQSKGQYDETILNSTNAKQIHDQSENDVKSLTASIDKIYQEYLEYAQNSEEVEIPQEMVEEHFNLSNTVRLQEFAVEAKKTALSHCAELLRNQDTLY